MQSALFALLLAGSAFAEKKPLLTGTVARNAFTLKRGAVEEDKPRKLHVKVNHTYAENEVEVWYINMADREDRRDCMEKQLLDMGVTPHRFEAISPTPEDLKEGGKYHECVKGGLLKDGAYIDATGGGHISSGKHTRMAVIGDSCSHQLLFKQLAESQSTAKYFLVLEDDAILNPLKFKTAINQFVDPQWGYKGQNAKDFQMVQLDFIGSFCMSHRVGRAAGKRVFKPKDIWMPGYNKGADCSRYFGTQAMLMQKDTLPSVVTHMETHKVVPMDHLQGELPRALAWRPQIAKSPIQKFNKLPEFCSQKMRKSSISFKREPKSKKSLDMDEWVEAFKTETTPDDKADDESEEDSSIPDID